MGHLAAPAFRRHFFRVGGNMRLFHGIYPDYRSALDDIPPMCTVGADNTDSIHRIAHERFRICDFDYPIMFWLDRLLPGCDLLFDWGGGVGISYFGFRKYLRYPDALCWMVCDLPAVMAIGAKIAEDERGTHLRFTTTLEGLGCAQILLAAGSLQFMEDPFRMLESCPILPAHILLNKLPVYDLEPAFTLQNMGPSICPYQLFNRQQVLTRFGAMGYSLVDEWHTPDLGCEIPFFPEHSIHAYSGFYFSRD